MTPLTGATNFTTNFTDVVYSQGTYSLSGTNCSFTTSNFSVYNEKLRGHMAYTCYGGKIRFSIHYGGSCARLRRRPATSMAALSSRISWPGVVLRITLRHTAHFMVMLSCPWGRRLGMPVVGKKCMCIRGLVLKQTCKVIRENR